MNKYMTVIGCEAFPCPIPGQGQMSQGNLRDTSRDWGYKGRFALFGSLKSDQTCQSGPPSEVQRWQA